jgi:vacuolar-type H+-ATPase subunit E/Vma4
VTTLAAPRTALEPLFEAHRQRAQREAEDLLRAAEDEGREALEEARRQVESAVETAREQGRAEGADLAAAELAAVRRTARARLLSAQAAVHAEVGRAARQAVAEVLDRPGQRRRLETVLRTRLGSPAVVRPTSDGGLEAVSEDGRTICASVAVLADSAVDELDLGELWSPP